MDDVTKLKGIGKGTAAVIEDLMATGESSLLKELEEIVPKGLLPLLKLPGLGGKIAKLHQALGIDSAESLKAACEAGKVRELAGFAVKLRKNFKGTSQFSKSFRTSTNLAARACGFTN